MTVLTLDRAPLGTPLVLQPVTDGRISHRMAALGLRRGAEVTLLHRTAGGGRVVLVRGTRVALGPGVLRQVRVERPA